MKDCVVIEIFVAYLRDNGYPDLCIDQIPDKENRQSKDIDAIAGPFAIEHTSIDTLPNQRGKSDWFMRVVGGLELPISPYRLNITLEYDAIAEGQNWAAIREAIKTWVIEDCPQLQDGRHTLENLPGIPFRLRVKKASDRPPRIMFSRIESEDESLPDRIRQHLEEKEKIKKLAPYQQLGFITVLLIESDDIALMNSSLMANALRQVFPDGLLPGLDEVWYVDTSISSEIEFQNLTNYLNRAIPGE
jgi:hypothetical protein